MLQQHSERRPHIESLNPQFEVVHFVISVEVVVAVVVEQLELEAPMLSATISAVAAAKVAESARYDTSHRHIFEDYHQLTNE